VKTTLRGWCLLSFFVHGSNHSTRFHLHLGKISSTNNYDCAGPGHDAPRDDATAGNDDAAAGHDATGHDDGRRNGATREEDLKN